jgi:hypothetical protein
MAKEISITVEQFNELNSLFTDTWDSVKVAFAMTDLIFRSMPFHKKHGRAMICKMADDLTKARHAFWEISYLLQNIKDNYPDEPVHEKINEGVTENE